MFRAKLKEDLHGPWVYGSLIYDGYTTVNGLKDLIDEMAEYAKQALICLNKGEITHYEKSGE